MQAAKPSFPAGPHACYDITSWLGGLEKWVHRVKRTRSDLDCRRKRKGWRREEYDSSEVGIM